MAKKEHPLKPFYSVLVLAFACSTLVATAAVGLRPYQQANKYLDQQRNILTAAGVYEPGVDIGQQFGGVDVRLVDLESGQFVEDGEIDPLTYDQLAAAASDEVGRKLDEPADIAGIGRREKYAPVYLVKDGGTVDKLVLPIRGKGLWSTMYGYLAVDADLTTIRGVSFYEHGETPGLGGEIANPRWQKGWQDKRIFDDSGDFNLTVAKSGAQPGPGEENYVIDGLSGATLTTQGVDDMMEFWFGENGFKPFFDRLRNQGGFNG